MKYKHVVYSIDFMLIDTEYMVLNLYIKDSKIYLLMGVN